MARLFSGLWKLLAGPQQPAAAHDRGAETPLPTADLPNNRVPAVAASPPVPTALVQPPPSLVAEPALSMEPPAPREPPVAREPRVHA